MNLALPMSSALRCCLVCVASSTSDGDCCGGLLLGAALDGLEDVGLGVGRLVNPAYVPLQVVRPRKGLAAVLEFKFFF